jgi:hypothetical protein
VDPNDSQFSAQNGMLLNKAGTTLIVYPSASGTVTLSGITTIGDFAFYGCTGLTSISFPEATTIGNFAFSGCTSLASASFPEVASIGGAFGVTGGTALTITLGNAPPTVEYFMFSGVYTTKTVTVRVPSAAVTAYDTAWQNAFKGVGNTGPTGTVSSYINLTIQGY